jgi:prepilin peptidase CpaA
MITIALVAFVMAAAWSDVQTRRIPNSLTVPGFVLALGLRAVWSVQSGSADPFLSGVAAFAIAFLVSFPLFAIRGLGGGDVKLLAMAGAYLGLEHIVPALLLSAAVGGVMGLWAAIRHGALVPVLRGCRDMILYYGTFGRMGYRPVLSDAGAVTIPYGVAIAVGSLAGWLV